MNRPYVLWNVPDNLSVYSNDVNFESQVAVTDATWSSEGLQAVTRGQ